MANHIPTSEELEMMALVQSRIVAQLFSQRTEKTVRAGIDSLVMKGGMALREAHDHYRHTSDIDLDADPDQLSLDTVQKIVGKAIRESLSDHILEDVVVSTPKMTPTVARWKIGGRVPGSTTEIHMKVEVSFRDHVYKEDIDTVSRDGIDIPVYTDEVMLLSKANALFSRQEGVLRDAADLYMLFSAGIMPSPERVLGRWGVDEIKRLHDMVARHIKSQDDGFIAQRLDRWATDEDRFRDQILAFWGNNNPPTSEEWMDMCLFVAEKLEVMWGQALEKAATIDPKNVCQKHLKNEEITRSSTQQGMKSG